MMRTASPARPRALGDFVRARREALTPTAVDLPPGARRRTPGLRREEVAQLAGLSVTWYTWLEQGRAMSVSPGALSRLAGALRLGPVERAALFDLAGKRDPEPGADPAQAVPPAVLACVQAIAAPAYVLDRAWTALAWNRAAERLFVGWLDGTGSRNLLRFFFLDPGARALIHGYDDQARRIAAAFRAGAGAHVDEQPIRGLVETLRRASPLFARLWDERQVAGREAGEWAFEHPEGGLRRYAPVAFDVAGRPDLTLTMFVPSASLPRPGTVLGATGAA